VAAFEQSYELLSFVGESAVALARGITHPSRLRWRPILFNIRSAGFDALTGLDPVSAGGVDELVLSLRNLFGLTIVMITHDLDLLWQVTDRVAVLGEGKVQGICSMAELSLLEHPAVRQFFDGPRGRAAGEQAKGETTWKRK